MFFMLNAQSLLMLQMQEPQITKTAKDNLFI